MAYLEIKDLSVAYCQGQVAAVRNCNLSLNRGETLGIVGESGSGKSTLALALLRMLSSKTAQVTGAVMLDGQIVSNFDNKAFDRIRWKEIAMVFQKSMNSFSPVHRLGRQLENIWLVHEPDKTRSEIKEKLLDLFVRCNLKPEVYRRYPFELSGGMLQRVSIVMALMHNPGVLILDEATTALDVLTQQQIILELKQLQKQFNFTVLVISHDLSVISKLCDRVAVMYCGQIVEMADAETIFTDGQYSHPYTEGLMLSIPRLDTPKDKKLEPIQGSVPNPLYLPAGCKFAPRCKYCTEKCQNEEPELAEVRPGHFVRCFFSEKAVRK